MSLSKKWICLNAFAALLTIQLAWNHRPLVCLIQLVFLLHRHKHRYPFSTGNAKRLFKPVTSYLSQLITKSVCLFLPTWRRRIHITTPSILEGYKGSKEEKILSLGVHLTSGYFKKALFMWYKRAIISSSGIEKFRTSDTNQWNSLILYDSSRVHTST